MNQKSKQPTDLKQLLSNRKTPIIESKIEDNFYHVIQQLKPLKAENIDLKNTILASQAYFEEQREHLSEIVRETGSREIVKRIADFPTLISILRSDMQQMSCTLERQTKQIEEQTSLLTKLSEERNNNYAIIKEQFNQQVSDHKKQIIEYQVELEQKSQQIIELCTKIDDESKLVKKNQNCHFEVLDSYNDKVDHLQQQLKEEMEKQAQSKLKYQQTIQKVQEEYQSQISLKQDQYEFALGELRNSYEKRMEKLIKDSEFRVSEANKSNIMANKELDQIRNKYDQEILKSEQQLNFIKNLQTQLVQQQQSQQNQKNQIQQQSIYMHQMQAIIANFKKSNLLTSAVEEELINTEQQLIKIQQEEYQIDEQDNNNNNNNNNNKQELQQIMENQEQQTSPSLMAKLPDQSYYSPTPFKLNLKNADQLTTQNTPMNPLFKLQNEEDKQIPELQLNSDQKFQQKVNLNKKLKKKRIYKQFNHRDELHFEQQDGQYNNNLSCHSQKYSEETPHSQFLNCSFSQSLKMQKRRRMSKLQNLQQQQQQFITQDNQCQTDDQCDFIIINENQKSINTQTQEHSNSNYFSPYHNQFSEQSNFKNTHQFSLQLLQSDHEELINSREEIQKLKEQISSLSMQTQSQAKKMVELQDSATQMEQTFKESVKQMKYQISKSQTENQQLLKQLEKPKEQTKRKIEMQKHLENEISRNESLQNQLIKASEVIRYFNQELENYKETYNIFASQEKKEKKKQRLPSLCYPHPSRRETPKKQRSMIEEAQRLIDNLYDIKSTRQKQY